MHFRLIRVAPFSAAKTLALYYALGGLVSSCVKYAHAEVRSRVVDGGSRGSITRRP